jgi:pyruvate dehydrogenase E1 component beta subunit
VTRRADTRERRAPRGSAQRGTAGGAKADAKADAKVEAKSPATTTYREALRAAHREAMQRDPRVFLMGEDVGRYGGSFAVSLGLLAEFGEDRVRDTPLSEAAFTGAGIGAALAGMRPIVEIMTVNFSLLALDQVLNNAATLRHMSGGQLSVPLVIRMTTGAGRQLAAQHSHSLEGWYAHIPGIRVLAPATLEDARGMLWPALQDPDPVVIFEHGSLYNLSGTLADPAPVVDITHAAVRRPGADVTVIAHGGSVGKALAAADLLAAQDIDAEVLDLRVLRPLDDAAIAASLAHTHRCVVVDEAWRTGSLAAEVSARIMEQSFWELDAPVERVCSVEVPVPYAQHLERATLPQPERIAEAAARTVGRRG